MVIPAIAFFCRFTQVGFFRLATNQSVFGQTRRYFAGGLAEIRYLLDRSTSFAEEPADLEKHWRTFTQHQSFSPKVWNVAYLAAFALAGNLELVTFDKAFKQYANVTFTVLP